MTSLRGTITAPIASDANHISLKTRFSISKPISLNPNSSSRCEPYKTYNKIPIWKPSLLNPTSFSEKADRINSSGKTYADLHTSKEGERNIRNNGRLADPPKKLEEEKKTPKDLGIFSISKPISLNTTSSSRCEPYRAYNKIPIWKPINFNPTSFSEKSNRIISSGKTIGSRKLTRSASKTKKAYADLDTCKGGGGNIEETKDDSPILPRISGRRRKHLKNKEWSI